jgi:hypothetical protein
VTLAELLTHPADLDASVIGMAARRLSQALPLRTFLARQMRTVMMPYSPGWPSSGSSFTGTFSVFTAEVARMSCWLWNNGRRDFPGVGGVFQITRSGRALY